MTCAGQKLGERTKSLQANFERMTDFGLGLPTDMRSRRERQIQRQRYDYIYLNVTLDQDEVAKQEFCNHLWLLRPDSHPECLWQRN